MGISAQTSVQQAMESHRRRRHRVGVLNNIEDMIDKARRETNRNASDKILWRAKNDVFKQKFITSQTWHQIRQHKPLVSWHRGI